MADNRALVTGAAGFIGYHLTQRLCREGWQVTGIDNLNSYYDVRLKQARLARLAEHNSFSFHRIDLANSNDLETLFESAGRNYDAVVNLAAQAGVRHSLDNPQSYVDSNLKGFVNLLECCRNHPPGHLVFASSSSVYGANTRMPFSTHDNVDHPVSLYAATKKANELMAHSYSHLFGLPVTGLRFFTVYGPWGRPDMALFLFTRAILNGEPIQVFNHGKMLRDFTYIDDIIEGVFRLLTRPAGPNPDWDGASPDPATSKAPYRLYNIGNNNPTTLLDFIAAIEAALGIKAEKEFQEIQPGDVPATCADVDDLMGDVGFKPSTSVQEGIARFVEWYLEYYGQSPVGSGA